MERFVTGVYKQFLDPSCCIIMSSSALSTILENEQVSFAQRANVINKQYHFLLRRETVGPIKVKREAR
ncbi:hypothetical protein I308_100894 [Cryptococcus tetragattii IND107]|uniref:Uncharacterized protein n=1 Tax=Cryptococcus tetragattii IND107 TaxID=1296105 RepID=A0ABR3BYX3_9TREE